MTAAKQCFSEHCWHVEPSGFKPQGIAQWESVQRPSATQHSAQPVLRPVVELILCVAHAVLLLLATPGGGYIRYIRYIRYMRYMRAPAACRRGTLPRAATCQT